MPFANIDQLTLDRLERAKATISGFNVEEPWSFEIGAEQLAEAGGDKLRKEVADRCKRAKCLYVVGVANGAVNLATLKAPFADARGNRKHLAFPRPNNFPTPGALYVGSSKNFGDRLWRHLGYGGPGTFALRLKEWLPLDVTLEVKVAIYSDATSEPALKEVETALWEHLKPLLGRSGSAR